MSHYRIAIVAPFEVSASNAAWACYQDLKLAGHLVEVVNTRFLGELSDEDLAPFAERFRPDYVARGGQTAEEVLAALADAGVEAHEGPAPRRFVVAGSVGVDNFGDELLFKTVCAHLARAYPGCVVSLVGSDPAKTLVRHGVAGVPFGEKAQVNALLNGASALLFIGGLIFDMPMEGGAGPIDLVLGAPYLIIPAQTAFVELAYLNGVPVNFFGIGAGPFENPDAQALVRLGSLMRPRYLARDDETARLLLAAGVDEALIARRADLVYAADFPAESPVARKALADAGVQRGRYAALSLRDVRRFAEQVEWAGRIEAAVACVLDELYERDGLRAVFLAFQPVDQSVHEAVRGLMRHPEAALLIDTADFDATTVIIRDAAFVVAMRLHCSIIAAAQGVPGVGLSYNVKVQQAYEQLGMADYLLPVGAGEQELSRACRGILADREALSARVAGAAARGRVLALQAFDELFLQVDAHEAVPVRQFDYPRSVSAEAAAHARTKDKLATARADAKRQKARADELARENEQLSAELARVRGSRTWKAGRALTWLPRALRRLWRRRRG